MLNIKFYLCAAAKRLGFLILAAVLGLCLLLAVYLLPTDAMMQNASDSSVILSEEGFFPVKWGEEIGSKLDNFTDALMIQNAIAPSTGNVLKDAVSVNHLQYGDSMAPVDDLHSQVLKQAGGSLHEYMRYWHGYLLFLKPLLLITGYNGIRILNGILQIFLILLVIFLMKKRGLTAYILPFLFSWLAIAPWALPYSMQLSTMYYIAMAGSAVLLGFYPFLRRHIFLYFMLLGILTSYFDYLTWPLISFGLPLIFVLLLERQKETFLLKRTLIRMIGLGFNWGLGYSGMWLLKWIISELTLHSGAISQAIGAAFYRSSTDSEGAGVTITAVLTWIENIKRVFNPAFFVGIVLFLILLAIDLIRQIRSGSSRLRIAPAVPFLLTALLPAAWYAVIKNHSFVHPYLTYRILWISIFAGMCMVRELYYDHSISDNRNISKER